MVKKDVTLLEAYLLLGEDDLKKETALEHLKKRLIDEGAFDFNYDSFSSQTDTTRERLLDSLRTLPAMSAFRLVVFEDIDLATKQIKDALTEYLQQPEPTTVLAMTADKLAKNTRLYKAIDSIGDKSIILCATKKRWELPNHVRSMAVSHGKTIDSEAAELLVSLVGESTVMLNTELQKVAEAIGSSQVITVNDVSKHVSRVAEVKPWDFLDAVCQRDSVKLMQLFNLMPSQSIIGLHILCVNRLRELLVAKSLAKEGRSGDLAKELGAQEWMVKNHLAWQRNYRSEELIAALRTGIECEYALKSRPDKEGTFITWILGVSNRCA